MFKIIQYFSDLVQDIYTQHADPRVSHYPMVGSMWPVLAVIFSYLMFVKKYGPKWMAKREPFDLKNIMRIYNAVQVVANIYIFYVGLRNSYLREEFSWSCQPIDTKNREPYMIRLLQATYWYYLTKYLDLLDTVFFVLRKKTKQITFLHVYHHAGMVMAVYIFTTFLAGSHATMLGVINLLVHTLMYLYYFVTSLKNVGRTLWWKRHITELQLLQFGYLIFHFSLALIAKDCRHPSLVASFGLVQNFFMFILFFDFYYKAYMRKSTKPLKEQSVPPALQQEVESTKLKSSKGRCRL